MRFSACVAAIAKPLLINVFMAFLAFGLIGISYSYGQEGTPEAIFDAVGKIQNEEILIIQKKFFPKAGRHEVTAGIIGAMPFDTFVVSLVGGASYAYHFTDTVGLEIPHIYYLRHFNTKFQEALVKTGDVPEVIRPNLLASASLFWSPLYGKAAIAQDQIYHADLYLLGGPTLSFSQESTSFGGVVGVGVRIFANRWLTIKFEFRDYIYPEKTYDFSGASPIVSGSTINNVYILSLGWSIYFPKFKFNPLE